MTAPGAARPWTTLEPDSYRDKVQSDIDESIRREVARIQKAIAVGVEKTLLPDLARVLTAHGYHVRAPIAVGDTVALTGTGWAGMTRPDLTGVMLGLEVTVVNITPGFGSPSVTFEVDGEQFIAPTRPGSRFQAELLPTEH